MARTALIIIDMLNPYDHEDADRLAASVAGQLPQMVELRDRAARVEDTLTIDVNGTPTLTHVADGALAG